MTTRCDRCGLEILPHEAAGSSRNEPAHARTVVCISRLRGALDHANDLGGDLDGLAIGALRYALGRMTYVVARTSEAIRLFAEWVTDRAPFGRVRDIYTEIHSR